MAARRAACGAGAPVSRDAVTARARACRADSRIFDGGGVLGPCAATARGVERELLRAPPRDLDCGRLWRSRASSGRGRGPVQRVRRGARTAELRMRRPSVLTVVVTAAAVLGAAW